MVTPVNGRPQPQVSQIGICSDIDKNPKANGKNMLAPFMPQGWVIPQVYLTTPEAILLEQYAALCKKANELKLFDKSEKQLNNGEKSIMHQIEDLGNTLLERGNELFVQYYNFEQGYEFPQYEDALTNYINTYTAFQAKYNLSIPGLGLLIRLYNADGLKYTDKELLYHLYFEAPPDDQIKQTVENRFIKSWEKMRDDQAILGESNSPEAEFATIMFDYPMSDYLQDVFSNNLDKMLSNMPKAYIAELQNMPERELSSLLTQSYFIYDILPTGSALKKIYYQRFLAQYVVATARNITSQNIVTSQDDRAMILRDKEGNPALRCAARVEDLPEEYQNILKQGNYYDFMCTNQGRGIVFADMKVKNDAFSDANAIFSWIASPGNLPEKVYWAMVVVHEAAHNELARVAPQEVINNSTANERHSLGHQIEFLTNYLKANKGKISSADHKAIIDILAGYKQMMRQFNYVLGFDLNDEDPHNYNIKIKNIRASQTRAQFNSSHHPAVTFIPTSRELKKIIDENEKIFGDDADALFEVLDRSILSAQPINQADIKLLIKHFKTLNIASIMQQLAFYDINHIAHKLETEL